MNRETILHTARSLRGVPARAALLGLTLLIASGCQTPWGRLDDETAPPVFERASLEPVRECPVCPSTGSDLDPNDASVVAYVFEGRTYLFSSEECLLEFKRDPYHYVQQH